MAGRPSDEVNNVYRESDPTKHPYYKKPPASVKEPTLQYIPKYRGSSILRGVMVLPDPNAPVEEEAHAAQEIPADDIDMSEIQEIMRANSTQRVAERLFEAEPDV